MCNLFVEIIAISSDSSEAIYLSDSSEAISCDPPSWLDYFPKDYKQKSVKVDAKVEVSSNVTKKDEAKLDFDARE